MIRIPRIRGTIVDKASQQYHQKRWITSPPGADSTLHYHILPEKWLSQLTLGQFRVLKFRPAEWSTFSLDSLRSFDRMCDCDSFFFFFLPVFPPCCLSPTPQVLGMLLRLSI